MAQNYMVKRKKWYSELVKLFKWAQKVFLTWSGWIIITKIALWGFFFFFLHFHNCFDPIYPGESGNVGLWQGSITITLVAVASDPRADRSVFHYSVSGWPHRQPVFSVGVSKVQSRRVPSVTQLLFPSLCPSVSACNFLVHVLWMYFFTNFSVC